MFQEAQIVFVDLAKLVDNLINLIMAIEKVFSVFYRWIWRQGIAAVAGEKGMSIRIFWFFCFFWVLHYVMQELKKTTSQAPHVRSLIILLLNKWDLGWPIPSRAHVTGNRSFLLMSGFAIRTNLTSNFLPHFLIVMFFSSELFFHERIPEPSRTSWTLTRETFGQCSWISKITKLDLTVIINQNICWLNISVQHICRVNKFYGTKEVVEDKNYIFLG